ncbi:MAG: PAS domain-containing sensor histidine kinase [Frankia sp.]|nr:PAS domain-containing sensor histidine kinase [Frankia sp.]
MTTLRDLVAQRAGLPDDDVDWLHLLVAEWHLLADLSFADLLLYVEDGPSFVTVAQVRPTTAQTLYQDDQVGRPADRAARGAIATAWREGRIVREGDPVWHGSVPARHEAIPVRRAGRTIAVIGRDTNLASPRVPSQLELTYLDLAGEIAQMVTDGSFPFAGTEPQLEVAPRVGDGLLRLDRDATVTYASPNALSAYRRLGLTGNAVGERAGSADGGPGLSDARLGKVLDAVAPVEFEVESAGAAVLHRAIPLLHDGVATGALVLVRDVTELRRRERQLISKDATIREIHHRVKNNLQTVAALLRLQARRLTSPDARAALEESVRRVSSIALVHETLSQTVDQQAAFDEIADKVIAMVADVSATEGPIDVRREGAAGTLPAEIATPLALVLAELLQNAVEHAFANTSGTLVVSLTRDDHWLRAVVRDDGVGLPASFSLDGSARLGLQIVRTLVVGELGGTIAVRPGVTRGTEVVLDVPLPA